MNSMDLFFICLAFQDISTIAFFTVTSRYITKGAMHSMLRCAACSHLRGTAGNTLRGVVGSTLRGFVCSFLREAAHSTLREAACISSREILHSAFRRDVPAALEGGHTETRLAFSVDTTRQFLEEISKARGNKIFLCFII